MNGNETWEHTIFPPHLIWESRSDSGKDASEVQRAASKYGCLAITTPNGWTTGEPFMQWTQAEFFDKTKYPPQKTLFILDLYAAHRTTELLTFFQGREIDVQSVPSGCTPKAQLIDMAVNRTFKKILKARFADRRASMHHNIVSPNRSLITKCVTRALRKTGTGRYEHAFKEVLLPALEKRLDELPLGSRTELRRSTVIVKYMKDTEQEADVVSKISPLNLSVGSQNARSKLRHCTGALL